MKNHKKGVTLVEIAIVLVIIGLLLGGVLKGQELINNAKIRSMADRQSSLKVAWFSFLDRYRGLPGDYALAANNIPGATAGDGDGTVQEDESVLAMQHLTASGYIRCAVCTYSSTTAGYPKADNSLVNQYGGVMSIWQTDEYAVRGGTASPLLMILTGARIPSNILAEVDRKVDDGMANGGDMVFNNYNANGASGGSGTAIPVTECMAKVAAPGAATDAKGGTINQTALANYRTQLALPPVYQDCGASIKV